MAAPTYTAAQILTDPAFTPRAEDQLPPLLARFFYSDSGFSVVTHTALPYEYLHALNHLDTLVPDASQAGWCH